MSYKFLMDIALILVSTKVLGLLTKRYQMPQVVGALLAGLILGPAMLNVLQATDFLAQVSELGVIVIMFTAGMGMSLNHFFASWGNFLHSSGATLTVALYVYAKERAEFDVAFAIAAILMLLTLVINLTAKLVGKKLKKK